MKKTRIIKGETGPRDRETKRLGILDAALEAFCELGFAGAKIVDIARRAGVAEGTIYLYFDNKDELWRVLFEANLILFTHQLERELSAIVDPEQRFSALVRFHLNQAEHNARIFQFLIARPPHTSKTSKLYRKQWEHYWLGLARHLEAVSTQNLSAASALSPRVAGQLCFRALASICEALVDKEIILDANALRALELRLVAFALGRTMSIS